eukprot:TRINITY_DN3919_c0_g1_i4.p1 TRINITY_DN3919_c0_g1~~TRINITY_DN3919_c0_g1_i4.p1  ORF type:complete len:293 (-),score=41.78 TRINITY_DN3919_c0_g1_i4:382-1260(-)
MRRLKEAIYFDTVKLVTVRNLRLAIAHRILEFIVVVYISVYAIWYKEGYQESSPVAGVIFTKVKGIALGSDGKVYDASDLVIPPVEDQAVFITTSSSSTVQHRGSCPDMGDSGKQCTENDDCPIGTPTNNGFFTGSCDPSTKYCVIRGWCPTENSNSTVLSYSGISNWTVFFRSQINYTIFGLQQNNSDRAELGYNIFSVQYMLGTSSDPSIFDTGAIIKTTIDWSCDLNYGICPPTFHFQRVDNLGGHHNSTNSSIGFNFRNIFYFNHNLNLSTPPTQIWTNRVMTKYYGG